MNCASTWSAPRCHSLITPRVHKATGLEAALKAAQEAQNVEAAEAGARGFAAEHVGTRLEESCNWTDWSNLEELIGNDGLCPHDRFDTTGSTPSFLAPTGRACG